MRGVSELYTSSKIGGNQMKGDTYPVPRRVGHIACMGKMRNKVLVERSEGKGQLGSCGNR
jgi:hypothetical protein